MEFFDSHAHITMPPLDDDVEGVIEGAKKENVTKIINVCTDQLSLEKALVVKEKFSENVFLAAATTPHDVEKDGKNFFPIVEKKLKNKTLVAIGEVGLDYYYMHSKKDVQQDFLKRYFSLAIKYNMPVILHCREAFEDLFKIVDNYFPSKKAVLHCFTGTLEEAKEVIKRGFMISFSGILTFKKSHTLRDVAKEMPIDNILIETDSPFLAPQKYRGKVNKPQFVNEVAKTLAEIKKISIEKIAKKTYKNASKLFLE